MSDGSTKERDRRECLLVGKHLDVNQAGRVIDRDVHELPADCLADSPLGIGPLRLVTTAFACDAVPGALVNPAELLDVDMDQLPGPLAFVALGWLQSETPEFAHPDLGQDPRDR